MKQFDIKLHGATGPFIVLAECSDHSSFIDTLPKNGLVTFKTGTKNDEVITVNVSAIEAISGPNKPFPVARFGERVFL